MGEAKRRKAAGTYPDGGPVEDFRVPGGKLGITVDISGENPSTLLFDADKVADLMQDLNQQIAERLPYHNMVRGLVAEFVKSRRKGGDLSGIAIGILWTALYHPQHGKIIRESVSRELRQKGRAHISWQVSKAGLAVAVADNFVDLEKLVAKAPKDITLAVSQRPPAEPKPN